MAGSGAMASVSRGVLVRHVQTVGSAGSSALMVTVRVPLGVPGLTALTWDD